VGANDAAQWFIVVAIWRDVEIAKLGRRNVRAAITLLREVVGLIACLVVLCFFLALKIPAYRSILGYRYS
jgi:hypothetical protein